MNKSENNAAIVNINEKTNLAVMQEWVMTGYSFDFYNTHKDELSISSEKAAIITKLYADLQKTGEETMKFQSVALHYASEPYYAQATIVAVVAGIQMGEAIVAQNFSLLEKDKSLLNENGLSLDRLLMMLKRYYLVGEFAQVDQEAFEKLEDSELKTRVMSAVTQAIEKGMVKIIEDYPLFANPELFKISMLENHGDFVKDFSHYLSNHDGNTPDGKKFILKGSKYLFRVAWCGDYYLKNIDKLVFPLELKTAFNTLKLEAKKILEVRQSSLGAKEDAKVCQESMKKILLAAQTLKFSTADTKELITAALVNLDDFEKLGHTLLLVVEEMVKILV